MGLHVSLAVTAAHSFIIIICLIKGLHWSDNSLDQARDTDQTVCRAGLQKVQGVPQSRKHSGDAEGDLQGVPDHQESDLCDN